MNQRCLTVPVTLLLCTPAFATTWVVDDDGGAGVDFTSISAALAVAQPGDVVSVRPGSYGGFTLQAGVSVLGSPGVVVTGEARIQALPAGPRAALTSMQVRTLVVSNCTAPVIVDDVDVRALFQTSVVVSGSADVRLRRADVRIGSGIEVATSRLEITDSIVHGRHGQDQIGDCCGGEDGSSALRLGAGADVHVSRTTVRGGDGGNAETWGNFPGGDGAPAIEVQHATARLLLTGTSADVVQGGAQGLAIDCPWDGVDGAGIFQAAGTVRVSGASVLGRTAACGAVTPPIVTAGGTLEQPSPADPALSLPVDTHPATQVTFSLTGAPGAAARLRLGRQAVVVDLPDVVEDRLTNPLRTYDLGTIPPGGVATFAFNLPAALADGFLIVAQGSVTDAGGTRLTQSVPIVLH